MKRMKLWAIMTALPALGVLPSQACAPMGEFEKAVRVVDESAVIVWDAKTETEHFVRQASFDSASRNIGFLVPSPTVPKLAEADDSVFGNFRQIMLPEVRHVKKHHWYGWKFTSLFMGRVSHTFNAAGNAMSNDDDGVKTLQFQRVAGYDATTLRARDAKSLNRWLKKNGYVSSPAFEKWLQPYIEKRWVITAFKIGKQTKNDRKFASSLVRMSFKTPRPFFPYSEPQTLKTSDSKTINAARSLRIFFISNARCRPSAAGFGNFSSWPGKAVWSDALGKKSSTAQNVAIGKQLALPTAAIFKSQWLTVFEDNSSPRPGTRDVYFERDKNIVKHLPPIIVVRWTPRPLYVEPLLAALAVVFAGGLWLVGRKQNPSR